MPQAQAQSASPITYLFLYVPIIFIFYFLLIRPQKQKEKERQKMLSNINKNDEVVTSGGIHGTIVNVKDKTVILRIDDNVKIEIEKNCIACLEKRQAA